MSERSFEEQLEAIWMRHWPTTMRQVQQIADALRTIEAGSSSTAAREAAAVVAHQLIGMAATFGRAELSDLARTAERLLSVDELSSPATADPGIVARELDRLCTS